MEKSKDTAALRELQIKTAWLDPYNTAVAIFPDFRMLSPALKERCQM